MHLNVLKNFGVRQFTLIIIAALLLLFIISITKITTQKSSDIDIDKVFSDKTYEEFKKIAQDFGVEYAYRLLKERFPNNETAAHDFAHVVGLVAYGKMDSAELSVCDTSFNYGCFHGFIEGFLIKKGTLAIKETESHCQSLGYIHMPSCIHGIGHGLMAYESYDLKKALSDCDNLEQSIRLYCWDGVFMERINASMQDPAKRAQIIDENNIKEPCQSISLIYKAQCWRNQVSAWFNFFGNNPQKVLAACYSIEKKFQEICFESVGLTNVMLTGDDITKLKGYCSSSSGQIIDNCIIGELKEILFEGKSPELARGLCNFASSQGKNDCNATFQDHYNQYRARFNR